MSNRLAPRAADDVAAAARSTVRRAGGSTTAKCAAPAHPSCRQSEASSLTISELRVPSTGAMLRPHGKGGAVDVAAFGMFSCPDRQPLLVLCHTICSIHCSCRATMHPVLGTASAPGRRSANATEEAGHRSAPRPSVRPVSSSLSSTTTWRPKPRCSGAVRARSFQIAAAAAQLGNRSQPCAS